MKSKTFFKNTKKAVVIIVGLLLLLAFAQCKKDDPVSPNGDKNYGKVEIPKGMSSTDIIITNFSEDAIPDENGDFAIGYSKMLVAKNINNGKIMYYTINSIDNSIRNVSSDCELSPKETAITLAIRMLPMIMGGGSDDVLEALKNVMYSLPCVQALEASILNVLNQYGYLKEEELESAINSVKTFIYSELEITGGNGLGQKNHKIRIEKDGVGQKDLRAPYLPIDMMHGTKIDIQEDRTQYIASPEHWSINCIGYNGLPCSFGLVVGNADMGNIGPNGEVQFDYDEDGLMYFLPPTGLSKGIDILTLGDWEGLKQLFIDIAHSFTDIHYEPSFYKAKLENIDFDIYLSDNVMGFICSEDNERVEIVNIMYLAFDAVSAVLPALDNFFGSIVPQFIGDAQYMSMFHNEIHNGSEGLETIYWETVVKLVTIGSNMAEQGLLQWVGRQGGESLTQEVSVFLEAISGLGILTKLGDMGLQGIGIGVVESFGLPIYADFNNNIVLSITAIEPVGIHSAHVDAHIIDAGLHPISEKGFCYSTSHNPGLDDNVVAGEHVSQSQFSCELEGLESNTTYYVRAYAKNNMELIGFSEEMYFTTLNGPTVTTLDATNITSTVAQVNAHVVYPNPNQPISYEKGFLYSTENGGLWYGSECEYAVYEGSSQNEFSCTLSNLEPNTPYYVKAYSKYENNLVAYGDVVSFTTLPEGGGGGNHEYVDLGLPSGTLWATCNVGANSPEEYGDYFAWGETQPKDYYEWSTYQHCMGSENTLTKYCNDSYYGYNGFTDDLTTLLPEDDAATANWGAGWRMPTQEEWQELLDNTTSVWTIQNGVNGRLFTAPNGNSLFLPAAGWRYGSSLGNAGGEGNYWSSSLLTSWPNLACFLYFDSGSRSPFGYLIRYTGQSVRPVLEH